MRWGASGKREKRARDASFCPAVGWPRYCCATPDPFPRCVRSIVWRSRAKRFVDCSRCPPAGGCARLRSGLRRQQAVQGTDGGQERGSGRRMIEEAALMLRERIPLAVWLAVILMGAHTDRVLA